MSSLIKKKKTHDGASKMTCSLCKVTINQPKPKPDPFVYVHCHTGIVNLYYFLNKHSINNTN